MHLMNKHLIFDVHSIHKLVVTLDEGWVWHSLDLAEHSMQLDKQIDVRDLHHCKEV